MWYVDRPPHDRTKRYRYICSHPELMHTERFVAMSCVIPVHRKPGRFFIIGKRSGRAFIVEEVK